MFDNFGVLDVVIIVIATVVISPILWIAVRLTIANLAENNIIFTFRKEGAFKYWMQGATCKLILYKLKDHYVDQATGNVIEQIGAGDEQATFAEWLFGAYYIGLPPNRILEFQVTYARPHRSNDPNTDTTGYTIDRNAGIVERTTTTTFMLFQAVYSVSVKDVEILGNFKVNMDGTITVEVENAWKPVFGQSNAWFAHISDAFKGAVNDFVKDKDFESLRKAPKAEIGNLLEDGIKATAGKGNDSGTIAITGMAIRSFNMGNYGISPGNPDEEAALKAMGIAELRAKSELVTANNKAAQKRIAADAEAYEIDETGKARARATEAQARAAGGGDQRLGAEVLKAQALSVAIQGHKGTLLFGGTPFVTINPDSDSAPSPQPPPTNNTLPQTTEENRTRNQRRER